MIEVVSHSISQHSVSQLACYPAVFQHRQGAWLQDVRQESAGGSGSIPHAAKEAGHIEKWFCDGVGKILSARAS